MYQLSAEVVRALSSAQVITSVHSVVKELVENSLDARATNIEVKLENYGADVIEVRDDGCGISKADVPNMAVAHYTSKLTSLDDMKGLETYGFRGEALASLAALSTLTITTRTREDDVATTYGIDHSGHVTSTKPSHLGVGTVVTALDLFKEAPVRRQLYRNPKHCRDDFRDVQEVLMAFGIAHPRVRFTLRHNRDLVWQKMQAENFRANLALVLGSEVANQLALFTDQSFSPMVKVFGYLPKPGADRGLVTKASADRLFQLVNRRPVVIKPIIQVIKETFQEAFPTESCRSVCPVGVVCVELLPEDIDVNVEPNKTVVLFHDIESVTAVIRSALSQLYRRTEALPSREDKGQECAAVSDSRPAVSSTSLRSGTATSITNPTTSSTNHTTSSTNHTTSSTNPTISSTPQFSVASMTPLTPPTSTITFPTNSTTAKAASPIPVTPSSTLFTLTPCSPQNEASNGTSPAFQASMPAWANMAASPGPDTVEGVTDPRILLDVSECEDFNYFSGDEGVESPARTVPEPEAETLASPWEQPPVTSTGAGSNWSRGRSITVGDGVPVEPVRVLRPHPLEEKSVKQSKLENRGPSPIYDLVNRQPVKRRSNGDREVGVASGRKQKMKKMTPRSYSLQKYVAPLVEHVTVDCDLCTTKDRYLTLCQVYGEGQKGEGVSKPPNGVIGHCRSPDVWLVVVDSNLGCFDVRSVQQAVLFERLMETHELPQLALPTPLVLNEGNLGCVANLAVLSELSYMQNILDGHWYCCDDSIVKNGFNIKKTLADCGTPQLELTHSYNTATSCSDLHQLAEMIRHSTNQRLCRPSSVQCYLRGEAHRMANAAALEKETVGSLLEDTLKRSGPGGHPSLHFFYAIL